MMRSVTPWSQPSVESSAVTAEPDDARSSLSPAGGVVNRRHFLAGMTGAALLSAVHSSKALAAVIPDTVVNLAKVATPAASYASGDTKLSALNDGSDPASSHDGRQGAWGTWPRTEPQWVQYEWSRPVTTNAVEVYWWVDGGGVNLPASWKISYWNGSEFVPVANAKGFGVKSNSFNRTTFDEVKTDKLRLEIASDGTHSTGILEWKVYSSGAVPLFPPTVDAGVDRSVVLGGGTYLTGKADWLVPGSGQRVGAGAVVIGRAHHDRAGLAPRRHRMHQRRHSSQPDARAVAERRGGRRHHRGLDGDRLLLGPASVAGQGHGGDGGHLSARNVGPQHATDAR